MSQTLDQIYIANPSTSMVSSDLLYLVHSPFTPGQDSAITYANFAASIGVSNVASITGTANEIIASSSTGAITLSTPQGIATTSSPTFSALTLTNPLPAGSGGTGIANTGTITVGGNTAFSGAYTFTGTLTNNTAVTFPTSGTLATVGGAGVLNPVAASTTPITATVNTAYYITDASQVTITLPTTAAAGSVVSIIGYGAGGWILMTGAGQTLMMNGATINTSVTSGAAPDCISIMCVVANTTWNTYSYVTSVGLTVL